MSATAARGLWGLTGGAASGKSTVARLFEKHGFATLDADQVARELSQPGSKAYDLIEARFGTADRAKIREIIFRDPAARAELERILHPLIVQESSSRLSEMLRKNKLPVFYEAALLVETGRAQDFDGLVVVVAPERARLERLAARDGVSAEAAARMVAAQLPDEVKAKSATYVIENSGTLDDLESAVADVAKKISTLYIPA